MKRTPRILLLDDDADMLDCWMDILKDKFHAVKTNSPFEAISFLDAGRDIIDLVICDQNMPGMTGVEFAEKMRALKIPIPVILCTGFISKNIQTDPKFLTIVEKPFSPETFLAAVEKALSVSSEETKSFNKTLLAVPEI